MDTQKNKELKRYPKKKFQRQKRQRQIWKHIREVSGGEEDAKIQQHKNTRQAGKQRDKVRNEQKQRVRDKVEV